MFDHNPDHDPTLRRLRAAIAAILAGATLTACSAAGVTATRSATTAAATVATSAVAALADNVESHAEADDADYDTADAVTVTLAEGASKTDADTGVTIEDDLVTITAPGTYLLGGQLSKGQVVVNSDAEGKVRIVLDDVSITSATGAAVAITAADEAVVVLADGSSNSLTDATGYDTTADDTPNAALFSMADLTIGGSGSLTVTGNTNDGIASKDGLVILGGGITVTAADDAIRGKDYLIIADGTVSVTAEGDGLKADNETDDTVGYVLVEGGSLTIAAGDDGVHTEGDLAIWGGSVKVTESTEGLEGATIAIAGGATEVTASDDGLNATTGTSSDTGGGGGGGGMQDDGSLLTISGGTLLVDSGGDGLDSNGALTVTGGTTVVSGPTNSGNGPLDANGGITVTGGVLVAAGSAGMAESPADGSTLGWVAVNLGQALAAGETVSIVKDSQVIAAYTAVKQVQTVVVADSDITSGETYDVYVGGRLTGTTVGSYAEGADISTATRSTTVTAGVALEGDMGGGGGGPRR